MKIRVKFEVCMDCRLCEVWCIVAHSKSKNIIKAFRYEKPRPLPRIRVGKDNIAVCRHCDKPKCVLTCPNRALYKKGGGVIYDELKCKGCYLCVSACPYGSIFEDEKRGKIIKCDLCRDLGHPMCVKKCPNEALVYVG